MNRKSLVAAVISVVCALVYLVVPKPVKADDPKTMPFYNNGTSIQRMEHDSIAVDTTRCVHLPVSVAADAGILSAADGGLPSSELSYICTVPGNENDVCLTQGSASGVGESCDFAFRIAAGSMTYPISFYPNPDGGQPVVTGLSATGTSDVTCCPVVGRITRSR